MKQQLLYLCCVLALAGCSGTSSSDQSSADSGGHVVSRSHPMPPPDGAMPPGPPPEGSQPPPGPPPEGFPAGVPMGSMSHKVMTGTGAYRLTNGQQVNGGTYTSLKDDENAIRAEGPITASLNNVSVLKTAGSATSNDGASFYGLNSAVLALKKAKLTINGGTVTATTEGSTGVFAYDGGQIHINNTHINVSGGNAGGIEVAGGGKIYANNLTVNAKVKAAIRSDRGGGKIVVNGGRYTTTGSMGAPAIYSTADIHVNNATLTSNDSEAVVIEGFNSVTLTNTNLTGHMDGIYGKKGGDVIRNVMLYQSMSGDAATGTSHFTMTGGSLVSNNGDMFYVTNTDSVVKLSQVNVVPAPGTKLLRVAGNNGTRHWGKVGANGGICDFSTDHQTLTGDILVDKISKLTFKLTDMSSYTGAINPDGTKAGLLSVSLDKNSHWSLTHDSYISAFHGSLKNVTLNGHHLYVNGKAITQGN